MHLWKWPAFELILPQNSSQKVICSNQTKMLVFNTGKKKEIKLITEIMKSLGNEQ